MRVVHRDVTASHKFSWESEPLVAQRNAWTTDGVSSAEKFSGVSELEKRKPLNAEEFGNLSQPSPISSG